jgi:hypothetical protein
METYHKINAPFKRHMDGPKKGRLILGDWALPEFEYLAKNRWEFTEKVDGTNIRIELQYSGDFMAVNYGGRTDNAVIPPALLRQLEATFPTFPTWRRDLQGPPHRDRYKHVGNWMHRNNLSHVVLYGEGYGPKIQSGGKYIDSKIVNDPDIPVQDKHKFVLFDVKIGDFWLNRLDVNDIAEQLGIEAVPVLGYGTLQDAIDIVTSGLVWDKDGRMQNYGLGLEDKKLFSGLKSRWGNFEAEGIVARPVIPLFNRKGERIITKIKGRDFK